VQDKDGNWPHRDGGHVYFEVPEGAELPESPQEYAHPEHGWVMKWGNCQVLTPPSARPEGVYTFSNPEIHTALRNASTSGLS
jgi:hypothetical protein